MKLLITASLLFCCAALADDEPPSLASAFVATDQVVKEFEQQGLTLNAQAISDLKWFEKHQGDLRGMFKQLKGYENAYTQTKNDARLTEIRSEKAKALLLGHHVPTYKPSLSFLQQLNNYKSGEGFKKGNEWVTSMRKNITTYQSEVGYLVPNAPATGSADAADLNAPPSVPGNLEVYVIGFSGDFDFYVNDQKVERAKQSFPLMGVGKFTLRAVGMGDKRKQSKTFQAPTNTTQLEATEYRLRYKTKINEFTGETDWQIANESVRFAGVSGGSKWKMVSGNSGKHKAVEGDLATFLLEAPFAFTATVTDVANWKATSVRPGGTKELTQTDTSTGSIQISVSPQLK